MAAARSGHPVNSTNVRFQWSRVAAVGALRVLGDRAPGLTGALAEWLWQTPARHQRPLREIEVLRRGVRVRVPLGTHGLSAWSWGEGPTVMLVHGWEGRGSQLAAFVDPLVQAGFRVVAFDAPGHGDSGGERSSLFSFADAIDAAARRFGPVYGVVAHSMGAAATGYAVMGGLDPQRIVFVAPADASKALPRFARQVGIGRQTEAVLAQSMIRKYGLPVAAFSAEQIGRRMAMDLMVVHDQDDRWVPLDDGQAWATGAGGQLLQTEGLGHHRILRDEGVVDRAVSWLAEGAVDVASEPLWFDDGRPLVLHKTWEPWDIELPELTEEEILEQLHYGRG